MKSTDITKIYMGDTQGQKLFLGDELIWPVTGPVPPTTSGSVIGIGYWMDGENAFQATYISPDGWVSKVQLDGLDGEEITISAGGVANITGITPGYHTLVYTLTGTSIPNNAFRCAGNKTVRAKWANLQYGGAWLTEIGSYAFGGSPITAATIPYTVTIIGENAFDMAGIGSSSPLHLDSAVEIYDTAFRHSELTNVIFGNLEYIGPLAFEFNDLRSIVLPASLLHIGNNAFNFNNHIGSVTFESATPPFIEDITSNFVSGTTYPIIVPSESLQAYQTAYSAVAPRIVPGPVMVVQAYGKDGNTMIIGSGATSVGSVFDLTRESFITPSVSGQKMYFNFGSSSLDYLYIQFTGNTIPAGAFSGCTDLISLSIPYGFTSIGASAFRKTRGTSYTIPASVTSIGNYAFNDCTGATEMIFEGEEPPTLEGTSSLGQTTYTFPIYVPDESVNSYREAGYWVRYASRIQPMSQRT